MRTGFRRLCGPGTQTGSPFLYDDIKWTQRVTARWRASQTTQAADAKTEVPLGIAARENCEPELARDDPSPRCDRRCLGCDHPRRGAAVSAASESDAITRIQGELCVSEVGSAFAIPPHDR